MAMAQAIRTETTGDEQMDLLVFTALMPETQLAVLQEADTNKFIVDFVRQLKAAGPLLASTHRRQQGAVALAVPQTQQQGPGLRGVPITSAQQLQGGRHLAGSCCEMKGGATSLGCCFGTFWQPLAAARWSAVWPSCVRVAPRQGQGDGVAGKTKE
ncbi:hypothetical protein VOLCADRAFT_100792 [Volvox carteri f. nagariensis]|uniref:Uncharacterized protein n=1 Tax=Volvox carteri f. nagariensis TaxID=3068 RepID=D8UL18_VOLCA|nr:uncharacterized protein VOLCADRAFT_100792 [Volvox carteri f. nagariensis]EFJ39580.1 hypothetical protein VOLCADRAFT_100792 [Volvox carteri f. nagariensis]|eukprot:XP_002959352.1 hypothetical protein VOLCADRAFT_100792 [Volvox carteri f. nagariensis]